jgi:HD-GYP domain-containing protein (c-di-GMP phosphodiesterase class II)
VREHPVITERILDHVPSFRHLSSLAGAHHERLDGDGYPRGLRRAELSLPMRILAVADVYEALTSERPYRPARTSDHAREIMRADVPERLDAEAFAALEDLLAGASPGAAAASVLGRTSSGGRARS